MVGAFCSPIMFNIVFPHMQYHGQPKQYEDGLDYVNIVFTVFFIIEFMLKVVAFKPRVSLFWILLM